MSRQRGLFAEIFKNFLKSFKARDSLAKAATRVVGEDPFGNKYFEIPADPSRGKRHPVRWYTAINTPTKPKLDQTFYDGFDAQLPAEWESWLRHRRDEPPSLEVVDQSLAIARLKKINAAKLEEERILKLKSEGVALSDLSEPKPQDHEKPFYPKRKEYELIPGEGIGRDEDRWKDFKNPYQKE